MDPVSTGKTAAKRGVPAASFLVRANWGVIEQMR
jgi:hypothetical protein